MSRNLNQQLDRLIGRRKEQIALLTEIVEAQEKENRERYEALTPEQKAKVKSPLPWNSKARPKKS